MAFKDTVNQLHRLLFNLHRDLEKAEKGNKAAAQRVRTGSIKLEKISKRYRKESILAERSGKMKKRKTAARKKRAKRRS